MGEFTYIMPVCWCRSFNRWTNSAVPKKKSFSFYLPNYIHSLNSPSNLPRAVPHPQAQKQISTNTPTVNHDIKMPSYCFIHVQSMYYFSLFYTFDFVSDGDQQLFYLQLATSNNSNNPHLQWFKI